MKEPSQLGLAWSPRTWAEYEGLTEATEGQPLRMPQSVAEVRKLTSTQISNTETQGSASNASTIFLGDWSSVLVGMRTNLTLESTRTGSDAMEKLDVLIRGYLRADWVVQYPKHLTRIIGVIPS